jgi:hypothetical protein
MRKGHSRQQRLEQQLLEQLHIQFKVVHIQKLADKSLLLLLPFGLQ